MGRQMRLLFDLDGVLADFNGRAIEQYNHMTNEGIKLAHIKSNNTAKWVGDPFTMRKIIEAAGFMRSLDPLPGAIEGIKRLVKEGHDVAFVSNGTNCVSSGHEKREWLKYHFGKLWKYPPLVLTYHKYLVRGDVIIDDLPRNLENLHPDTKGLLWHTTYNIDPANDKYTRIYSWDHLFQWIEENG